MKSLMLVPLAGVLAVLAAAEPAQGQVYFGTGRSGPAVYFNTPNFSFQYGRGYPYYSGYSPYNYGYRGFYQPYYYGNYPYYNQWYGNYRYSTPGYYYNYRPTYSRWSYTPMYTGWGNVRGYSTNLSYSDGPSSSRTYQSFYSPSNEQQAWVRIRVPSPSARVWFDGTQTSQQGTDRLYVTPPLDPSKSYSYTIRASWMDNGQEVSREKVVTVTPGKEATADFTERTTP